MVKNAKVPSFPYLSNVEATVPIREKLQTKGVWISSTESFDSVVMITHETNLKVWLPYKTSSFQVL